MTEKVSGIYKIVNKLDGKYYVGSSEDVFGSSGRWNRHKWLLREHRHHCIHLQRACDRDGLDNFDCILVESVVDTTQLLVVEQTYLDIARQNPSECYNSSFDAGRITMTDDVRAKIGEANKRRFGGRPEDHPMFGRKHSEETRAKIRAARAKQGPPTEEGRRKISQTHKGKKLPERSLAQLGLGNPNASKTIYSFENVNTGERFSGRQYTFIQKYNLPRWYAVDLIRKGKTKRGWRCISPDLPRSSCSGQSERS